MKTTLLDSISDPSELRKLNILQLRQLAGEIRHFLIDSTNKTGGHLSSNLGVVELSIMLHYCFATPKDQIVWDVGHQAYVHKILTGRKERMNTIRQFGGLSGFPKRSESKYDVFDTGHSSTSISACVGLAKARDILKEDHYVISVIGDGALTGGMAYEALNNASSITKKFIVILNDNQMSIDKNVGGMALYLDKIRTSQIYNEVKSDVEKVLLKVPNLGKPMITAIKGIKNSVKQLVIPGMFFEELGFTYLGPIDGNDLHQLQSAMKQAKMAKGPVLLHVKTIKGKGFEPAENDPKKYHGVKARSVIEEDQDVLKEVMIESRTTYSELVGSILCRLAKENPKVVAITAAMCSGTGLDEFAKRYTKRFFDVGIAEQHAVTFAAGLSVKGLKPYFVVYSSFLQRAYDQIVHDVALQKLPVVFCIDRGGLVGDDGETHQGVFDLSYLSHIPNVVVIAPSSGEELALALDFAEQYQEGPVFIRYPKGKVDYEEERVHTIEGLVLGRPLMNKKTQRSLLIGVGNFYKKAVMIREKMTENGYLMDLADLRFVTPIQREVLEQFETYERIYVIEENVVLGGATSVIRSKMNPRSKAQVYAFGIPDVFVPHGEVNELYTMLKLDDESLFQRILAIEKGEDIG